VISVIGIDGVRADTDGDGNARYTVTYKAIATLQPSVDDEVKVAATVIAVTGYDIGSPWRNDAGALCKRISPNCKTRRDKRSPVWEWSVEFEFSSDIGKQNPQGPQNQRDPVLRPPRLSVEVETYEQPTMQAAGGAPIKNSAGDPVIRMKKRSRTVFRYSRYMRAWDWQNTQEAPTGFLYSLNATEWNPVGPYGNLLGIAKVPALKARVEGMKTELSSEFGGCVQVDTVVKVDLDGFSEKFFDAGFFFLADPGVTTPGGGRPPVEARRFFVDRGGIAARPQLLDGNGRPNGLNANPVTLTYNLYLVKEWNDSPMREYFN
jgi:hypothetical protein